MPGAHEQKHACANGQREPAPIGQLEQIRGKKAHIHCQEKGGGCSDGQQRVFPAPAHHKEGQHGGDQHVQRDCNAISRSQSTGRLEENDGQRNACAQPPVHQRQINLARVCFAGVQHLQARQITQLYDLFGDAECARNQRLRGNHRSRRGQHHHRQQQGAWRHGKEGVADSIGLLQQQSPLAQVIDQQCGHGNAKPRLPNGAFAKVAQVCIQRFSTCDAQHDGTQQQKCHPRLLPHKCERMVGAEGPQNLRMLGNVPKPQCSQAEKP